jgi:hypothetical protein
MSTQIPKIKLLYDDYNWQKIFAYQATAISIIFAPHSNIGETIPGSNHVPKPGYKNYSQHASHSGWRNKIEIYLIVD